MATKRKEPESQWISWFLYSFELPLLCMSAATIARSWGQFMEFMLICSKKNVDVVCIDKVEDAQAIFRRIQEFKKRFFEGSDVTCV